MKKGNNYPKEVLEFLSGKSDLTIDLFDHFIREFQHVGPITLHAAKTMIGIATPRKRIAYVTQLGKNFVHVVFMFAEEHTDNLCFQKVARVPGQQQFNHHFRMLATEDVNSEVKKFMALAYEEGLK